MIKLTEQVMINILKHEMVLPDDQVWIRDQNKVLPNDKKLYIIVGLANSQPYSSASHTLDSPDGLLEVQQVIMRENMQIDILSRSVDAIMRRYEVLAALRSIYSQQMQEIYNFKIFALPTSFNNTSDAEGGSNLNRFTIVIPCHTWYRKEKLVTGNDYYNDFDTRVDDEQTIGTDTGIIEFNITEEL